MTLLVRDEEDIVEENIHFHLGMGVDFVIATDNKSVDGTTDILRKYEKLGLLYLIREEADDYAQSKWVTRMAQLAKERFNAAWVINSDADEFWWPNSGNLAETLRRIPRYYQVVSAPRHDFVARVSRGPGRWYDHMVFRKSISTNVGGRPPSPKICHRGAKNIKVCQGNHKASWPYRLFVSPQTPISILHFPVRSYRQFENKIVKGGAAYARNTELSPNIGDSWRKLYKQWMQGKLLEHYQKQLWSDGQLQQGIDDGHLIHDTRLRDFLQLNAGVEPS